MIYFNEHAPSVHSDCLLYVKNFKFMLLVMAQEQKHSPDFLI